VTVEGRHYVQEDSPEKIGRALSEFVDAVRAGAASPAGAMGAAR
jgi:hypothetical protein